MIWVPKRDEFGREYHWNGRLKKGLDGTEYHIDGSIAKDWRGVEYWEGERYPNSMVRDRERNRKMLNRIEMGLETPFPTSFDYGANHGIQDFDLDEDSESSREPAFISTKFHWAPAIGTLLISMGLGSAFYYGLKPYAEESIRTMSLSGDLGPLTVLALLSLGAAKLIGDIW